MKNFRDLVENVAQMNEQKVKGTSWPGTIKKDYDISVPEGRIQYNLVDGSAFLYLNKSEVAKYPTLSYGYFEISKKLSDRELAQIESLIQRELERIYSRKSFPYS